MLELQGVAPNAQALSPQLWTGYAGVWLTLRSEEAEAYSAASCEGELLHMAYLPPALLSHRRGAGGLTAPCNANSYATAAALASRLLACAVLTHTTTWGDWGGFARLLTPTSSLPQRPRRPVRRRP